jgi:hypothetical protein
MIAGRSGNINLPHEKDKSGNTNPLSEISICLG